MTTLPHAIGGSVSMAYWLTSLLLCLNLLLLWVASGAVRAKGGLAVNPEDGARYNVPVSDRDPPAVARILRAHRNAEAVIYPFLLLGLVYILAGGDIRLCRTYLCHFCRLANSAHRVLHCRQAALENRVVRNIPTRDHCAVGG
jgi:uncharacterized MAPEG superfamily protein